MKLMNAVIAATGLSLVAYGPWSIAQSVLPKPDPQFTGTADIDVRKSVPEWPKPVTAMKGAPNILLILVDDVGFSTTSTFGGPVNTPVYSGLAAAGLRYNQFAVNALCSPSRGTLLSGRNAHEIGFGTVAEVGAGYPGYNTLWPKEDAPIAEVLKDNGYSTAAFGKWHNTPQWQVSPAGPFDRWPTGLGFEHFYGFIDGSDNQYYPRIYRDTTPVEPGKTPEQGYHFTVDMTDDAIHWLHQQDAAAPEKPFFVYFATGATHTPLQVPKPWIAKYKGKFDQGWDKLRDENFEREKKLGVIPANAEDTPRPAGLPAWESLSATEQKLVSREMEVYAGFAEQTDHEIGLLLQAIKDEGKADNTLVIWIFGDNGASAQGGDTGYDMYNVDGSPKTAAARLAVDDGLGSELYMNHYAAAWAWSLCAPFQGAKEDSSHLGGTRDPMVLSWPVRVKDVGGLRTQFAHLTDVAPTLYEAAGITPPETVNGVMQTKLEGVSLSYTFDDANAPSRHHVQYFETNGSRAIYKDGWWAGDPVRYTWEPNGDVGTEDTAQTDYNVRPWELYNLNDDYSQAHNLAAKHPEKLKELQALFDEEAVRNQVYPLLPKYGLLPTPVRLGQTTFVYRDGVDRLTNDVAPPLSGKAYTLTADVDVPAGGAKGVIMAQGGRYGGVTLFVKDNHVVYVVNAFGNKSGEVVSMDALAAGKAHIVLQLTPEKQNQESIASPFKIKKAVPGTMTLMVNGKAEGEAHVINVAGGARETLDVGKDLGSAVSAEYAAPYDFTGTIEKVTIELKK